MLFIRLLKINFVLCFVFIAGSLSAVSNEAEIKAGGKSIVGSYKIAVCDWMILKRQKIGEFELAKELGCDGVELDMGSLGQRDSFDNKLRKPEFQQLFKSKSQECGVEISSIAMSGFYGQSFAKHKNYLELVQDCLNTMGQMGVKVAFLPLGVQCDLRKMPELRTEVVQRLHTVGEMAIRAGVVIGIETSLSANEEVRLLKEVNSKGIQIYFNFANPLTEGRNLYTELEILGKERICMIHCTDTDSLLLQDNKRLDMNKVKITLIKMKWTGWLVVERSRDVKDVHNVKMNYGSNVKYMKSIFQQASQL